MIRIYRKVHPIMKRGEEVESKLRTNLLYCSTALAYQSVVPSFRRSVVIISHILQHIRKATWRIKHGRPWLRPPFDGSSILSVIHPIQPLSSAIASPVGHHNDPLASPEPGPTSNPPHRHATTTAWYISLPRRLWANRQTSLEHAWWHSCLRRECPLVAGSGERMFVSRPIVMSRGHAVAGGWAVGPRPRGDTLGRRRWK
jgi:hypothetical protein